MLLLYYYVCLMPTLLQRQDRAIPSRVCKQNTVSYCEFLSDDSECSNILEGDNVSDEDEEYDATTERNPKYDSKRGEDNWVGRRVLKNFGEHGDFEGVVYAVDEDTNNNGYRLFCVYYFDDPEDPESMWPNELMK